MGQGLRPFVLHRMEDVTGVSGTGIVAEGVEFSNGWVALTWLTEYTSVVFYPSMGSVYAIHGHQGKTDVVWGIPSNYSVVEKPTSFPDVKDDPRDGPEYTDR